MPELVRVDRRDDGVALVVLDRPKANALSIELLSALEAAAEGLRDDKPGAVVVWGGPRIFAAGADITEFGGPRRPGGSVATSERRSTPGRRCRGPRSRR